MPQTKQKTQALPAEKNGDGKVLDLTALAPTRTLVRIPTLEKPVEGEVFELRLVDDFGIEMQHKLLAWSKKFAQLMAKANNGDELDEDESNRLRFVLDAVFEATLQSADGSPLTKAQQAKVDDPGRQRVMQGFTWGPTLESQRMQAALIDRLVQRKQLKQEHVDEVMAEIRAELMAQLSTSVS
jgi:hypothetical protein